MSKSNFKERVHEIVKTIPRGKVMSYGQVALILGMPRAAQAVGWMLHITSESDDIPCQRVVTKDGRLSRAYSYGGISRHRLDLEEEGIMVSDDNRVNMAVYQWWPKKEEVKKLELSGEYLDYLGTRYF